MYDRKSESVQDNYVRNTTVHSEVKTLENIPPIQAAVKQHFKYTCCQANCWNQALVTYPNTYARAFWLYQLCCSMFWSFYVLILFCVCM